MDTPPARTRLSIVIPVYDEAATIGRIVERVRSVPLADLGVDREIVVVNDGSKDGTREALDRLAPIVDVIHHHERNQGKGAAMRTGLALATGDVLVVQDADLEYDPAEHVKMLRPILDGRADVVYGSRFRGGEAGRVLYYWHFVGNHLLTTLSNMTTGLNLTDMECGPKMFRRACLEGVKLGQDRFGFEPEITAKLAAGGWRFYEVGVGYDGRSYAQGKKITWRDGFAAIWCIARYGLAPGVRRHPAR